jgi:nucleotide-binding universal stress UspA family protein
MKETASTADGIPVRFERILFAADFSPASATALPYVGAIARHFNSELFVAHVIPRSEYAHIPEAEHPAALQRMRQNAESRLTESLASINLPGVSHQVLIEHGEVLPVLSSLAAKYKADLIAAGTHGPHGLEKLMSGSTAEEISRIATRPVLLVGPQVKTPPQTEVHLRRILHATDFLPEARHALEFSYALAREYAALLLVLHVVDNPFGEPLATRMSADAFCRLRLLENRWPEGQRGVEPEFLLEFGSKEAKTLEILEKRGVQLLVLSEPTSSHPDLAGRLPGPLAYNLVTHACCPVLTIRSQRRKDERAAKD